MTKHEYESLLKKSTNTNGKSALDLLVELCFDRDFPEDFYFRYGDYGIWIFCMWSIRVFMGDGYKHNDNEIAEYDFEEFDNLADGYIDETKKTMFDMMREVSSKDVEFVKYSSEVKNRPAWFYSLKKQLKNRYA